MKTRLRVVIMMGLTALMVSIGFGGSGAEMSKTQKGHFTMERAEENLVLALGSDNRGLRLSAASVLVTVGTSRSVIPLLTLLHNGDEEERIVAALALSHIDDGRGKFAVLRTASFDPSDKVRELAGWYYAEYSTPKHTTISELDIFSPAPYPEITEMLP